MAQNVTINGADYPSVPRIDVPITGTQNLAQFFDTSDADASAADVLAGKVFYNALGKIIGTGGGGGGLEYETGEYTPSSNIAAPEISFAKTHSKVPVVLVMTDTKNTAHTTTSSNYFWSFVDVKQLMGVGFPYNGSTPATEPNGVYAVVLTVYRSSSSADTSQYYACRYSTSNTTDSDTQYPRYFVNESKFKPYCLNSSRLWRSNRTYKWIAIWK